MKRMIFIVVMLTLHLGASEIYTTFSIEAQKSANLAFDAGGIVKKIHVDVSSVVKKGDLLATLKNDDIKASLRIAKAALQKAKVSLKFAKKDFQRQKLIKDLIDEAKFDTYLFAYESAKVAVEEAKAHVSYKQSLLDKSVIHAPFDGVIFQKSVEVGDVVSGMMLRTVFKIQSQKEQKLILEFDQKYWRAVHVGDKVHYMVNGDDKKYTGVIAKVYPFASSKNRKIKAEVNVSGFVVGLFGDGQIIVPDAE
jgi:RND family efflux transporter MFP subunit